jgi:predicted DNA-binding transcriptional regulator AlpA
MPRIRPLEAVLRPEAAAKFVGLSISTLEADRRKRHLGIPFIRLGRRRVVYRPSDLTAWLDSVCEDQGRAKSRPCPTALKASRLEGHKNRRGRKGGERHGR